MNNPTSPSSNDDIRPDPSGVEGMSGSFLDDNLPADGLSDNYSVEERRRIVDLQWLHSLLECSVDSNKNRTNQAIDAVVSRLHLDDNTLQIRDSDGVVGATTVNGLEISRGDAGRVHLRQDRSTVPQRTRRILKNSLLSATTVMLILMAWWLAQPESAEAMVDRAMKAAQDSFDRVYGVAFVLRGTAVPIKNARLTVRGGDRFVFQHTGLLGQPLYIGKNSQEYWLIPRIGPVLVTDSESVLPLWSNDSGIEMPFLQLTTALRRIRDDYKLKRLPTETLENRGLQLNHIEANRPLADADQGRRSPSKIEIWSDPASGVVHKMVLSWSNQDATSQILSVTFHLIESHSPDETKGLYEYVTYAPGRNVRRVQRNQ